MSVNGGRINFFIHPENAVRDEDFGQVISADIKKIMEQ